MAEPREVSLSRYAYETSHGTYPGAYVGPCLLALHRVAVRIVIFIWQEGALGWLIMLEHSVVSRAPISFLGGELRVRWLTHGGPDGCICLRSSSVSLRIHEN